MFSNCFEILSNWKINSNSAPYKIAFFELSKVVAFEPPVAIRILSIGLLMFLPNTPKAYVSFFSVNNSYFTLIFKFSVSFKSGFPITEEPSGST